jgi:hypothetical protein
MGFGDFIRKSRAVIGKGLMRTGGVLRKVGETGAPIIRKVGQVSGILSKVAPIVGAALAPATGGASLGLGMAIGKGLGKVSQYAGRAEEIAGKIGGLGQKLQTVGGVVAPAAPVAAPPMGMGGSALPPRRR